MKKYFIFHLDDEPETVIWLPKSVFYRLKKRFRNNEITYTLENQDAASDSINLDGDASAESADRHYKMKAKYIIGKFNNEEFTIHYHLYSDKDGFNQAVVKHHDQALFFILDMMGQNGAEVDVYGKDVHRQLKESGMLKDSNYFVLTAFRSSIEDKLDGIDPAFIMQKPVDVVNFVDKLLNKLLAY
ncbi:MAG: hypothetical protein HQM01_06240 [Magnetococcales bacterium]|nr:hypothetical protein [Magnetococcales bacterium]